MARIELKDVRRVFVRTEGVALIKGVEFDAAVEAGVGTKEFFKSQCSSPSICVYRYENIYELMNISSAKSFLLT